MKKRTVLVYVLCSLLLTSMAAALLVRLAASIVSPHVYGPNLLTNPGFEYGLTGWTTLGAAVFTADSSTFVSGRYSCKGVDNSGESLDRLYQDVTGVTSPGNQYQISGWIKTSNVVGWVVIGLDYVAPDGSMLSEGDYVAEIGPASETSYTQNWTYFSSEVFTLPSMPSDAQALWFWVGFEYSTGTTWWDNVSLVLATSPAPVPTGTYVGVILNDYVNLTFDNVTSAGYATATATSSYPPPPPSPGPSVAAAATGTAQLSPGFSFIGPVWDITTTAKFSGQVTVAIVFPADAYPTQMLQTDIVPGDVNRDGVVNCTDLLLILKALCSTPGSPRWNPNCDINHDNQINLLDLLIALKNYGKTSQWIDITWYIDWTNHIVYGRTDHFSLIGIH